jgi:small-conductance mechanosensitive channel/CRP-like cAMP-binding protein
MPATPLQEILLLSLIGRNLRFIVEAVLGLVAATGALIVRRRRRTLRASALRASSLVMLALGFMLDAVSAPRWVQSMQWPRWTEALALVLVSWSAIKILLDAADAAAYRRRAQFSTIFKDLLMLALFVVIIMAVLMKDIRVDPTPLLASSAVVAVVFGLALQETLGNVFNGLALQLGKPFAPGDWVRTGAVSGRIQGIGWRSTTVLSRANERLEIPNAMMAKDVVVNYSHGAVADEVSIGLSYDAPPNYVREVILEVLRSISGVLQSPPPEVFAWEYGDSAVRYRIKYWMTDYGDADRLHDAVATSLWYALRRKAIAIPYPVRMLKQQPAAAPGLAAQEFERGLMEELRHVDFLRGLSEDHLRLLLPGLSVLKFGAGEIIVREGDQGDSLYIIRDGAVEVVANAGDGKQVHIRDLKRPAFFGEMAVMTGEPRNATIRARTDAELLELGRGGFTELFKIYPEATAQIGEVITLRMSERRELLEAAHRSDGADTRGNWLLAKMRSVFNLDTEH